MDQITKKRLDSYLRISSITVVAVYFLILVGGVVRSTGSGMGCPDWPKCFGSVVPPTDVSQLPENYQEIYLEKRLAKNERFVATLEKIGLRKSAEKIANDKSILIEEEFNATKTWIEYINRLIGVVIGFLIILTCWRSLSLRKLDVSIPVYSFLALVVVLFTGWIGSIVVSTNLLAGMITFHMLLAIALVLILLLGYQRAYLSLKTVKQSYQAVPSKVMWILGIAFALMLIQVVLGTQVREQIDRISFALGDFLREEWIDRVGISFLVHRSFSLVILAVHLLYLIWALRFSSRKTSIGKWSLVLILVLIMEIATGIGMAYFGIPAFLQPIHLLLGCMLLGIQFWLILKLRESSSLAINSN